MKKTDLNKVVKDFVKWVNENKEALGQKEDVMIAPKLSAEEMETMLDSLGETIAETLEDGPLKDQFVNEYNNLASAFDLFKKEGEKESTQSETKPPATGIFQAPPAPADIPTAPVTIDVPPQEQPAKPPK